MSQVRRIDQWFEIHRWGQDWLTPDYRNFLANLGKPVMMIEPVPEIPTSQAYPKQRMIDLFGPYFFTSTPAWMLALAIDQGAEEIGIFGIDMASDDEYVQQKQGCQHFIELAIARGIKITVPPESDLMRPPPPYGFDEVSPMKRKLEARSGELIQRIRNADAQLDQAQRDKLYLSGALDNLRYIMTTWID